MDNRNTIHIRIRKADGIAQTVAVPEGATFEAVLRHLGTDHNREYVTLDSGELISPTTVLTRNFDCLEVAARAACGGRIEDFPKKVPYCSRLRKFWARSTRDLLYNLSLSWPILALFVFATAISALLLSQFEGMKASDSLYLTWITMSTVGYGDLTVSTPVGRVITSVDAFLGILLMGVTIWLVRVLCKREIRTRDNQRQDHFCLVLFGTRWRIDAPFLTDDQ